LKISPNFAEDRTVLAISFEHGGLYKSVDRGLTWYKHGSSGNFPSSNDGFAVVFSPAYAADKTLFLSVGDTQTGAGQILKSADGGASWTAFNSGLPTALPNGVQPVMGALEISPNFENDKTLFGACSEGLFRTDVNDEAGTHWSFLFNQDGFVETIAFSPFFNNSTNREVLVAGFSIFKKTVNGGSSWTNVANGVPTPSTPSYGQDYHKVATGLRSPTESITFAGGFESSSTQLSIGIRSDNFGGAWSSLAIGQHEDIYSFAISPAFEVDGRAFVSLRSTSNSGVYRSVDGGTNWGLDSSGLSGDALLVGRFAISPAFISDGIIFAGTLDGLYIDPRVPRPPKEIPPHPPHHLDREGDYISLSHGTCEPGSSDSLLEIGFDASRKPSNFVLSFVDADGTTLAQRQIEGLSSGHNTISWRKGWGTIPAGAAKVVLSAFGAPWYFDNETVEIPRLRSLASLLSRLGGKQEIGPKLEAGKNLIAYPNPARSLANVIFRNPSPGSASLMLFDLQGQLLRSKELGQLSAGVHERPLDLEGLAPGLYFVALRFDSGQGAAFRATFKLAIVK
jgi:hypothetical protein